MREATTVVITRHETDRLLEWTVLAARAADPVGHRFGYRLEPRGTGILARTVE
ncbi:hypothetical protein [Amycolatopsis sp. 195334CR]|uniref:hypothetical protein n=1 Tax=Amycolatopsis sp. 195334CR TaxID=2814588 RepID=UPI001A8C918B|nr:hypothetical protein [Amycolatopsis sp. 195334CR]MBN6038441.1 hypothetical protein [Amycolatopsis sp. 195334CR]